MDTVKSANEDPRPRYAHATAQMAALIESVRPEQLGDPTPCPDYDVRGLLGHIVGNVHDVAHIGETGVPPEGYTELADVPDDGWGKAYAEARERQAAAWADDATLETVVALPWVTGPGRVVLPSFVLETVTHTWDLAQALGDRRQLDAELADAAMEVARLALPPERRGEGVPFGPVQPAPEGADAYGRLAAWLGRRADWRRTDAG